MAFTLKLSAMHHFKKIIYVLLSLNVLIGMLMTGCETKSETKPYSKPISITDKANLDKKAKWEASADGIAYKNWEESAEGKKVKSSHDKIRKEIKGFSNMEAVVTSVTFKRENAKPSPKWLIVTIGGEQYMMQFVPSDFEKLKDLKVNDKITVRSRSAGYSHNHPYLIISGDYIAKDDKILFERNFSKNKDC